MKIFPKQNNYKQGVTIFFAILIIGLLLGIGVSISALAAKQLNLSNLGNQSELAFYAADSGAECALFWDKNASPLVFDPTASGGTSPSFVCNNETLTATQDTSSYGHATWNFSVNFDNNACASVILKKTLDNGVWVSNLTSNGYNSCEGFTIGQRLERAVNLTY